MPYRMPAAFLRGASAHALGPSAAAPRGPLRAHAAERGVKSTPRAETAAQQRRALDAAQRRRCTPCAAHQAQRRRLHGRRTRGPSGVGRSGGPIPLVARMPPSCGCAWPRRCRRRPLSC